MDNGKLLLVDDKQANLIALNSVLSGGDYELHETLNGYEAAKKAQEHEYMAILLDVQMPILDGFETAELIRKTEKNRSTPIIFLTANYTTSAYEQKGYESGAVDYLYKPINTDILQAKVAFFSKMHQNKKLIQKQSALLNETALREKENEYLRESLKARDQFLLMAAHELKTPITPLNLQIQSFIKLIKDDQLQNANPDVLKRMLLTSHSQVERLNKTIDDLLDVAKFTTGQLQLKPQPTHLKDVVQKVLNLFDPQLKAVGCTPQLTVHDDVQGVWDPYRLEQIVINLLSNAMKYAAGKPVELTIKRSGDDAELSVKDYGIGIDPADKERIFKRFERAVSPEYFGGLGLGLFICCEIVKLHKGSIRVESEPGHGATFFVHLPLS